MAYSLSFKEQWWGSLYWSIYFFYSTCFFLLDSCKTAHYCLVVLWVSTPPYLAGEVCRNSGPCSHAVPPVSASHKCTGHFSLKSFSYGCSEMLCDFPALIFHLEHALARQKVTFISPVFQEFYIDVIFVGDKVILSID